MTVRIPDNLDALLVPIGDVRPDPSNYNQHSAPGSNRETGGASPTVPLLTEDDR